MPDGSQEDNFHFIHLLKSIKRRRQLQDTIREKLRNIDTACIQNKDLLIDIEARTQIEQQKIAIASEEKRLERQERDQIRSMRKYISELRYELAELKRKSK